jgi:hypothetical protein
MLVLKLIPHPLLLEEKGRMIFEVEVILRTIGY